VSVYHLDDFLVDERAEHRQGVCLCLMLYESDQLPSAQHLVDQRRTMIAGGDQRACLRICGAGVLVLFSAIIRSQHREPSDHLPRMSDPFTRLGPEIERLLVECHTHLHDLIADIFAEISLD
jgi:hypothetical protein